MSPSSPFPSSLYALRPKRIEYLRDNNVPQALFVNPVAEKEQKHLHSLLGEPKLLPPIREIYDFGTGYPLTTVVGASGSGKTFARFYIEKEVRNQQRRMVVLLTERATTLDSHVIFRSLIESVVYELFLMWLLGKLPSPTQAETLLQTWFLWGGKSLLYACDVLVQQENLPLQPDISISHRIEDIFWEFGGRRIRLSSITPHQIEIIQALIPTTTSAMPPPEAYTATQWQILLQNLKVLEIESIWIVADCFSVSGTVQRAASLIKAATVSTNNTIRCTMFLPATLAKDAQFLGCPIHTIQWNNDDLTKLLENRLHSHRVDGSTVYDFLSKSTVRALVQNANGSPRRLLTLVNMAFESHLSMHGDALPIGTDVMQEVEQQIRKQEASIEADASSL